MKPTQKPCKICKYFNEFYYECRLLEVPVQGLGCELHEEKEKSVN